LGLALLAATEEVLGPLEIIKVLGMINAGWIFPATPTSSTDAPIFSLLCLALAAGTLALPSGSTLPGHYGPHMVDETVRQWRRLDALVDNLAIPVSTAFTGRPGTRSSTAKRRQNVIRRLVCLAMKPITAAPQRIPEQPITEAADTAAADGIAYSRPQTQ
jgi:hypothetical protein